MAEASLERRVLNIGKMNLRKCLGYAYREYAVSFSLVLK